MNIPSLKVLDGIGFDAAISRAASLLDITDPEEIRSTFPRVYPLGLGVIGASPLKMARAFAVFANGGQAVAPVSIRSVEDRDGLLLLEPEKEIRTKMAARGKGNQVVSPQNAAVMVDMLKRVVQSGTLAGQSSSGAIFRQTGPGGKQYTIPAGGKTGTTENWADAWTVGFTPYMTTSIWFGFDRPGNSLGTEQTGALLAGTIWANYMKDIHRGLPYRDFPKPLTGLAEATVCAISGQVPTEYCTDGRVSLLFLEGTQPIVACEVHGPAPVHTNQDTTAGTDTTSTVRSDTGVAEPAVSKPATAKSAESASTSGTH
jgi:penicillin-binding protein 1A